MLKSLFRWPVLINAALFQILWFACVLGSAKGLLWPSVLAFLILAAYQLWPSRRHSTDLKVLLISFILGVIVDSTWVQAGFVEFTDQRPFAALAPAWIILLWMGFALTINHSLKWLASHPLIPGVLGLIGGPLSYLAGQRIGAVDFQQNTTLIVICVGIAWAMALTILVRAGGGIEPAQE